MILIECFNQNFTIRKKDLVNYDRKNNTTYYLCDEQFAG